jgi:threonyl-tRNA synthetase
VQVRIIPVTDDQREYARAILEKLREHDFRVEADDRSEKVGLKIREAELQKIPYMLIVGAREVEEDTVSVRRKGKGDMGPRQVEKLIEDMMEEIRSRK